jgi:DnaJ homolog subfamily C member 19
MTLFALLAGAALWYLLDAKRLLRDRAQWPVLATAVIGLVLLAKGHLFIGGALVAGVGFWSWWPRRKLRSKRAEVLRLSRTEACGLLGVPADADRETILAAHRRLIARNHPDNGGTEGLAAQLNAARDLLLQQNRP